MSGTTYVSGATGVLWAGRALDNALETGDEIEVQEAVAELLRVAQARETAGEAVQGFGSALDGRTEALSPVDELARILTELDLGETLITAGHAIGEQGAPAAAVPLGHALDRLDSDVWFIQAGADPAVLGFAAAADLTIPATDVLRSSFEAAVGSVVDGTSAVATEVLKGIASVPAAAAQPLLTGAVNTLGLLPQTGPVLAAGLRAVRRALQALEGLVPESIRTELRSLARRWWGDRSASLMDTAARRVLGVGAVTAAAAEVFARTLDGSRARTGAAALDALAERHRRLTAVVNGIVRALSALVGPIAAMLAAAAWLYGAAMIGYLSALGAVLWIGRDCLDAGVPLDRIAGVRTILAEVTG
jgi:hypothetical protein